MPEAQATATPAKPTVAPVVPPKVGEVKERLRVERTDKSVIFHSYTGTGWGDEKKKILHTETFTLTEVPDVLETSEGAISVKGYGLSKILMERSSQVSQTAGKSPTDKLKAMREDYEVLKTGKWRDYAEQGPRAKTIKVDPALAQAVAEAKKVSFVVAMAALGKKTKEELVAIAALPALATRIAALQKEAASVQISF